jgi:hypothetical protein
VELDPDAEIVPDLRQQGGDFSFAQLMVDPHGGRTR